ncbi:hypothetical protein [Streptacidiphilus sp. EB129]|uniref:hypothetical protein n=1 Tax=Streptacidiphilus sp. EB129 TaxID=3156262 RepID=UPI0035138382
MKSSRRSIRTIVAATALTLSAAAGVAAAPAASADTPPSYCYNSGSGFNHYYAFDHTYTSGGHTYFQYSTLELNGDNYYWNGQFSYECDGHATPSGAGSYPGEIQYIFDHSYVSGGNTYNQYSTLWWDGSNWWWNGFVSYEV